MRELNHVDTEHLKRWDHDPEWIAFLDKTVATDAANQAKAEELSACEDACARLRGELDRQRALAAVGRGDQKSVTAAKKAFEQADENRVRVAGEGIVLAEELGSLRSGREVVQGECMKKYDEALRADYMATLAELRELLPRATDLNDKLLRLGQLHDASFGRWARNNLPPHDPPSLPLCAFERPLRRGAIELWEADVELALKRTAAREKKFREAEKVGAA